MFVESYCRSSLAIALCSAGSLLAMFSLAATSSAKIDKSNRHLPPALPNAPLTSPVTDWSIMTSPNTSPTQNNFLEAVTCASALDCWVVGDYNSEAGIEQTLVQHWDGNFWSIVTSPNTSTAQNNYLTSVSCTSASDCSAVGYFLNESSVNQTLVARWDGNVWSIVASPNTDVAQDNLLLSVICTSASDCWAAGFYKTGSLYQTLIEHWNGTTWSIITSPNAAGGQNNFFNSVTCTSTSDCWAVGYYYNGTINQTLIERWNGTTWSIVSSPDTSPPQTDSLNGVTCPSNSNCWAVGYTSGGTFSQTLIEHWNGTAWSIVTAPNIGTTQTNLLDGVACASTSDCWAVGEYLTNDTSIPQPLIEHFDGTSWSVITAPTMGVTQNNFLNSVACVAGSACWAVAWYDTGTVFQTLAAQHIIPPLKITSVTRPSAGHFTITGQGLPNFDINIQTSQDSVNFTNLNGVTSDATGVFQYDDSSATGRAKFYRAAYP